MARNGRCSISGTLAAALANAVRLYYLGRWSDEVRLPKPKAVNYYYSPGGTGLTDTLTRQDMQRALEYLKLFKPQHHRTLLAGLGGKLKTEQQATRYYLALCALWEQLNRITLKEGGNG